MPEWLRDSFDQGSDLAAPVLALRLAVAFVLGCGVAGIYRFTHGRPGGQTLGLMATLVLLTVLIGMVTLVIGNRANSVALAFSLVGALSIVRFRTVVEDTRDTAFVIFAVVVGMAAGSGFLLVPLLGMPLVALAALLFRPRAGNGAADTLEFTLTIRFGMSQDPADLLRASFAKHLEHARLTATATVRQGAALDLSYHVRLHREDEAVPLVAALNGLEGVQSVELRRV